MSDADEIPDPAALQRLRRLDPQAAENNASFLALLTWHSYKHSLRCEEISNSVGHPVAVPGGLLSLVGAQAVRRIFCAGASPGPTRAYFYTPESLLCQTLYTP